MKSILLIKVQLLDSNPIIYRSILVSNEMTFFELHHSIQITMGWANCHLFEFNLEGYRIGEIYDDGRTEDLGSSELLDSRTLLLKDLITHRNETFSYLYDFGDYWQHLITVENFLEKDSNLKYPICINGQMNCPPDDSGGIGNFYDSMEILKDKNHSEYKENLVWFGRTYDMSKFDIEKANRKLKKLRKYIRDWDI